MADMVFYQRLKTVMIARLIILTVVLLAGVLFLEVSRVVFYNLIGLCYGLTVIYALFLRSRKHLYFLAFLQIVIDLLFETAIIHFSGGLESGFAILYIISIFTACILFSARASLATAAMASFLYVLLVVGEYAGLITRYPTGLELYGEPLTVFYLVYVRITIFCLVGFLASILAKRLTRMEARVRQQERLSAMGEMAANIAHEIRNPLAAITGSVELLKESLSVDGEAKRLMSLVIRESDRLQKFMDRYLDFVRSRPRKRSRCDLVSLVNEVVAVIRTNNQSRTDLVIGWGEGQQEELIIWADPVEMRQLFLNLLLNGVEAMPDGGRVAVRLAESENGVTLSVQDQGMGIPKSRMKHLFEPLTTTKEKGTGLGLVIAKRIVESHGGHLSVRSIPGKGTTFTVHLPKEAPEARHEAA